MAEKYVALKENLNDEDRHLYEMMVASKKGKMLPHQTGIMYQLHAILRRKLKELFRRILQPLRSAVGNWRFLAWLFTVLREHTESILRGAGIRSPDKTQPLRATAEDEEGSLPHSRLESPLRGCGDTIQTTAAVGRGAVTRSPLQGLAAVLTRGATQRNGLRTCPARQRSRLSRGMLFLLRAVAFSTQIAQGRFPETLRLSIERQTSQSGVWSTLVTRISRLVDMGKTFFSCHFRAARDAGRFHLFRWRQGDFSHEQRMWCQALAASPSRQDVMDVCSDILKDEDFDDLAFWFVDGQATAVIVALFIAFAWMADVLASSLCLPPGPAAVLSGHQLISAANLSNSVMTALPQVMTQA